MTHATKSPGYTIRGLWFPEGPGLRSEADRLALETLVQEDPFLRAATSTVRSSDTVVLHGAGNGLLPALLAGVHGVPNLWVIEPDPDRRTHLQQIADANDLIRLRIRCSFPDKLVPTFWIADMRLPVAQELSGFPEHGLRGAVLHLPDQPAGVSRSFECARAAGLTYFPRQSRGNVVTLLSRWT